MAPIKTAGSKKSGKYPGVTKLSDGRYLVRKTWTDRRTGQKIYRRKIVAGTEDQAVAARAALREQEKSESALSRPRFRGFAKSWLKRKKNLEPSTKARYTADVAHLVVEFGRWWVDAIDYDALEKWQEEMHELVLVPKSDPPRREHKYAAATINSWHRTLRLILDRAVRKKLLPANPARQLATLTEGRTRGARGTSLEAGQLRDFMAAIPVCVQEELVAPDVGRGLYVYGWTGMRAGEIIALGWSYIVDGEFLVERSVGRDGVTKDDKTNDPRRITVVEPLVAVLEEQRNWLLKTQHAGLASGLVFPANPQQAKAGATRREGPVRWFRSQSTFQQAISAVCKKAQVPRITPHSLRRTFENLTRAAGVEALVRRAIHGWRSERTQGIYATVSREERDDAARAVVRLVLG